MDRKARVLRFARREHLGLEIAPFHNPLAPKRDGWNCLSLDICDEAALRALAASSEDPVVRENLAQIEPVDLVASASDLAEAVGRVGKLGQFDYICSSHNFEHLPNPIKFLRECGSVLKPGGHLSMAIPDKRETFDLVRTLTSLKDLLEAYHGGWMRPSPFHRFDSDNTLMKVDGQAPVLTGDLVLAYERLLARLDATDYQDTHVWVFTQRSFLQLIADLMILRLIPLRLIASDREGIEFFVHFRNVGYEEIATMREPLLVGRAQRLLGAFRN